MNLPDLKEAKIRTKNEVLKELFVLDNKYINIVENKKYFIKTYGCQMNEHDSENIKALLEQLGFCEVSSYLEADLIILNTCSIRENAHNKVFGLIGRIKHLKETKNDLILGITGCMPQEEVVANKILDKYKWIDFVIGTHNITELPKLIEESLKEKKLKIEVFSTEGTITEGIPTIRNNKYKAFINIMYGCDKFCTYCIVPFTRGKQRSRDKEDIIKEIKELIKDGYQEITLLGQNVNAYGKDLDINYNMANLLEDVAKTNISRIRFVTSHPWDFTEDMITIMKKHKNIMPHIHLPVQSGNNEILKLMGRKYTKENYLTLFNKLKQEISNISISTDIIVGFPNETKEQFQDTLNLVNECKFDLAYTFIFSKRVGTPAYNMEDNITMEIKEAHLQELNTLVKKYALESNKKMLNKVVPVLVEGFSEKNKEMLMGYTDTNKLVNLKGPKEIIGKIINVKITATKTWSLDGEYLK